MPIELGPISWERMIRAVEKVRERLHRATAALEAAGIPYAVIGGNAVASWVSRVDESLVRNTRDVDILLRRADFERAKTALASAGFIHHQVLGVETFMDGPDGRPGDGVHLIFAGEIVRAGDREETPDVAQSERDKLFQLVSLDGLVRMKLTAFRRKDQMHLIDLIHVGLVDASWISQLPDNLATRLQELLDNPEG